MLKSCLLTTVVFVGTLQAAVSDAHENTPAMSQHYGHGTPKLSPLIDVNHKTYDVDPKGRWTLLYFWADWCVPCIEKGIPDLITFTQAHEAQRSRFEIVAIRFGSTHENYDWKDFRERTLHLEQTAWHQVPPFPIVDDDSSQFSTDWGIHALPSYALIDLRGNLVRGGNLATLASMLATKK